jgi:putative ABC transport system ATP-binding protein
LRSAIWPNGVDNGGEPLTILHEISFAVAAGETVAIVGASGSGKSTLLGLLAGLDLPSERLGDSGRREPGDARRGRARRIAWSPAGFRLSDLPVVAVADGDRKRHVAARTRGQPTPRSEAEFWLQRVGLAHRLQHYPKHLSGGEQQRVALARAFAPGRGWCWPTSRPATSTR